MKIDLEAQRKELDILLRDPKEQRFIVQQLDLDNRALAEVKAIAEHIIAVDSAVAPQFEDWLSRWFGE